MRILIQIILPLVTPIILYYLWCYIENKRRGRGMPSLEEGHWIWVIIIGIFLSIGSLAFFATSGAETNKNYESPRLENGKIIPGKHR